VRSLLGDSAPQKFSAAKQCEKVDAVFGMTNDPHTTLVDAHASECTARETHSL